MRTLLFEDSVSGKLSWTLPGIVAEAISELPDPCQTEIMQAIERSMKLKLGILTDVILSGDELLFNANLLEESLKRLVVIMQRNGGDV